MTEQPVRGMPRMHVGRAAMVLQRSTEKRIQAAQTITCLGMFYHRIPSASDVTRKSNEVGNICFSEDETPM